MTKVMQAVNTFLDDEEGLTIVEYAVAGALISAVVVVAFTDLGVAVKDVIDGLTTDIGGTPTV
ncbi:Flp family type IVb pilin [Marinimicrobium sp. C2-29]|uniref:Flp family type IVb pilin n=1 Tax=Marinimicrobium sp. C2-29 TaxID=3139825 RepID=UPI0031386713